MEILDRIIGELKDALRYFKKRSEKKYYGDRFEEWVVMHSNISKDPYVKIEETSCYWRLLEWRGDKYIEGYRPLSSSSPDLLLECISKTGKAYVVGDVIAVECKWRSKENFFLEPEDIKKYERYMNDNKRGFRIKQLFYVFGFGWLSGNPQSVYVVPANKLYDYDKGSGTIKFCTKETKAQSLSECKQELPFLIYYIKEES